MYFFVCTLQTQDPYSRPWASSSTKNEKNDSSGEKMVKPAKGKLNIKRDQYFTKIIGDGLLNVVSNLLLLGSVHSWNTATVFCH